MIQPAIVAIYRKSRQGKPPSSYYCQVQHYLAVTGAKKAYLAIFYLHKRVLRWMEIERDEEDIEALMKEEEAFWKGHIESGIPPDPDGSNATESAFRQVYRYADPEKTVELDAELDADLMTIEALKAQARELEKEQKACEERVKMRMDKAEKAESEHWRVSWKSAKRKTFDKQKLLEDHPEIDESLYTKESMYRTFRTSRKLEGERTRRPLREEARRRSRMPFRLKLMMTSRSLRMTRICHSKQRWHQDGISPDAVYQARVIQFADPFIPTRNRVYKAFIGKNARRYRINTGFIIVNPRKIRDITGFSRNIRGNFRMFKRAFDILQNAFLAAGQKTR